MGKPEGFDLFLWFTSNFDTKNPPQQEGVHFCLFEGG